MKNKTKSHIVWTVPTSNRKCVETEEKSIPYNTPHDRSLPWFGTGILVQSDGVKLVYGHVSVFHL